MKGKLNLTRLSTKECKAVKGGRPPCTCVCELYPDATSNQVNVQVQVYFT
jgi:hypothetical protein